MTTELEVRIRQVYPWTDDSYHLLMVNRIEFVHRKRSSFYQEYQAHKTSTTTIQNELKCKTARVPSELHDNHTSGESAAVHGLQADLQVASFAQCFHAQRTTDGEEHTCSLTCEETQ